MILRIFALLICLTLLFVYLYYLIAIWKLPNVPVGLKIVFCVLGIIGAATCPMFHKENWKL